MQYSWCILSAFKNLSGFRSFPLYLCARELLFIYLKLILKTSELFITFMLLLFLFSCFKLRMIFLSGCQSCLLFPDFHGLSGEPPRSSRCSHIKSCELIQPKYLSIQIKLQKLLHVLHKMLLQNDCFATVLLCNLTSHPALTCIALTFCLHRSWAYSTLFQCKRRAIEADLHIFQASESFEKHTAFALFNILFHSFFYMIHNILCFKN